jgi:hypothetical protein
MDSTNAISQIRAETAVLSGAVTRIHPLVPGLGDAPTQGEILKALFELTKQVFTELNGIVARKEGPRFLPEDFLPLLRRQVEAK